MTVYVIALPGVLDSIHVKSHAEAVLNVGWIDDNL